MSLTATIPDDKRPRSRSATRLPDPKSWKAKLAPVLNFLAGTFLSMLYFQRHAILSTNSHLIVTAVSTVVDYAIGLEAFLYETLNLPHPTSSSLSSSSLRKGLTLPLQGGFPIEAFDLDIEERYTKYGCPAPQYNIRVLSRDPGIIYIENFLFPEEVEHFLRIGETKFKRSEVVNDEGGSKVSDYRTSATAFLTKSGTSVIKCVEKRASQFQGNVPIENMESLQLVRYFGGQEYQPHYDWFGNDTDGDVKELKRGGQRMTSFFVYLLDNCTLGETSFNRVNLEKEFVERHCDIITCDPQDYEYAGRTDEIDPANHRLGGLKVKPKKGNAVFWHNVMVGSEDDEGDIMTYHAGLPVGEGEKMAINIWTRRNTFT